MGGLDSNFPRVFRDIWIENSAFLLINELFCQIIENSDLFLSLQK
jgi:hypothetical protein